MLVSFELCLTEPVQITQIIVGISLSTKSLGMLEKLSKVTAQVEIT